MFTLNIFLLQTFSKPKYPQRMEVGGQFGMNGKNNCRVRT